MQKVLAVVLLCGLGMMAWAGTPGKGKSLWQPWEEVKMKARDNNQPIIIDMYTDWCHYCKIMDVTTYRNDSVVDFLKKNYQRFKFNPEKKDTLTWQNQTFTFNSRYEVHDFAVYLTRGSIVYPTTIIITPGGQPFYKHGEISVGEMEMLLKYFAVSRKGGPTLEEFAKAFKPGWK